MDANRRNFLKSGLLGVSGTLSACGLSKTSPVLSDSGLLLKDEQIFLAADTGPDLDNRCAASLNTGHLLNETVELRLISGALPSDMTGHTFVVFAEPHHEQASLFAGHGVIMRLDYGKDGVNLSMRMAETPCYFTDIATLDTDYGFNYSDLARFSMTLGNRVLANTAFVPMDDRLLVTYDVGRPHEMDPGTLAVKTPVGRMSDWKGTMPDWMSSFMKWPFPLAMSTAHPTWDHEAKKLYIVNFAPTALSQSPFFTLMRWDGSGELEKWNLLLPSGEPATIAQSVHQLCVTRNHVVICDTAFASEFLDIFGFSSETMHATETRFYFVSKDQLVNGGGTAVAQSIVVPREAIHFLADFDDDDGFITMHVAHNVSTDGSEYLKEGDVLLTGEAVRPELHGLLPAPMDLGALARYVVDTSLWTVLESKVIIEDPWMWGGPGFFTWKGQNVPDRFTSIFWSSTGMTQDQLIQRMVDIYEDHPYRSVAIEDLPADGGPSTIFRQDALNMEIVDGFVFPQGRHGSTPEFVPRVNAQNDLDGYIVCTVVSDDTSSDDSTGDEFWVFLADDLALGPIARLGHPELNFPFTLHSCWTQNANPRSATYHIDLESDMRETVESLSDEIQAVFTQKVYPFFE